MARTISGVYSYAITDQAGQTGAYVFLSLINPVASGKLIAIRKLDYQAYGVAASITKISKRMSRISSVSGGVDVSGTAIAKHDTTFSNALATLKITNPTVGQVADIKSFPPAIIITAAGTYPSPEVDFNPRSDDDDIILREGQGISIYQTAAGTANETMNFRVSWMEYT